ncbi:hypothetical protein STENM223S_05288 [Streptomyces tendae]
MPSSSVKYGSSSEPAVLGKMATCLANDIWWAASVTWCAKATAAGLRSLRAFTIRPITYMLTCPVLVIWSVMPMFLYRFGACFLKLARSSALPGFMATAPVRNFFPEDSGVAVSACGSRALASYSSL